MAISLLCAAASLALNRASLTYPIVGSGQLVCSNEERVIPAPLRGQPCFGQDAQAGYAAPSYDLLKDGTARDRVTGLVWIRDPGAKKTWKEAMAAARTCRAGGRSDWRMPTIKELYSLIDFSGEDVRMEDDPDGAHKPFINARVFRFRYGDPERGDRIIDSQYWSSTVYTSRTMVNDRSAFGVNFADGRIKAYAIEPVQARGGWEMKGYALYVRGRSDYGVNRLRKGEGGTVVDDATGLMWAQKDSGRPLGWKDAFAYASSSRLAGHSDWRVPTAKELQSIVDYTRSPKATHSPAIDPVFQCTRISIEEGRTDWGFYWTSTTHQAEGGGVAEGVYVCFGEGLGYMPGAGRRLMDVHGAGCQRCEWKTDYSRESAQGFGPQGDVVRGRHLVRLVRAAFRQPQAESGTSDADRKLYKRFLH